MKAGIERGHISLPFPPFNDAYRGGEIYLHVANNVRVYELTLVFSLQLLATDLALASMA